MKTSDGSWTTAQHGPAAGACATPPVDPVAPPAAASEGHDEGADVCCDLVTVPARQGLEAVDILRRGAGEAPAVGPVVLDGDCDNLGFLVPSGTAAGWDMPGSACTETAGRGLRIPAEPPVTGGAWLLPPGGAVGGVTDPAVLREALDEAARLIEAADSTR
ncbi:hypothetical protein OG875_20710 [Streptomyces sp. NBC_01498]|uniref:hypothetical protein n=1 Tax=Streptomyces sp. NBC_01498 TaxID=2975870 RepID=UPI002E7B3B93|nr:hypothetical protein [Streptomyces sp. NBC_01498]WTL28923.1 hypothetical protein OG875_20710 [Streptomyces sp. NBC_01498]